jgi:hypothetical protein
MLAGVEARLTTHRQRAVTAPLGTATTPSLVWIASHAICAGVQGASVPTLTPDLSRNCSCT